LDSSHGQQEPAGSFSNNLPNGQREVLHVFNHGDHTTIERSTSGIDTRLGELRVTALRTTDELEHVTTLHDGETYQFTLQTDRMIEPIPALLRHEGTK
jgi:hypothetical protein